MKKITAITLTSMMLLLATAMVVGAVPNVEVRGAVAGTVNGTSNLAPDGSFAWNPQNYAGFYYDIKKDIGTEKLTTTVTGDKKLSGSEPRGIIYETAPKDTTFKFKPWGIYSVIGFLADKYFAGYPANTYFANKSTDDNALGSSQLFKILMDNDDERTVTSGTPLKLMEGYELAVKSIDVDGNKVYVELNKDGALVNSAVISPSTAGAGLDQQTYIYKMDVGDMKKLTLIAVNFKNAFRGADQNLATVNGVWQISDTFADVSNNKDFDKMTITSSNENGIKMENKDNDMTLSRNKDLVIMPGVNIKTADSADLRFYVYKLITEPGEYQIRGEVTTTSFEWNPQNFAGFFYDMKKDIGTETLTTTVTGDKKLSGSETDRGIIYQTAPKDTTFKFKPWGTYSVIGFLAEKYFAGYPANTYFANKSTDDNALGSSQLFKILMDNDDERTVTSGTPLKLMEGYELAVKSIDVDGNKVYVELNKDGALVDSAVISPSTAGAGLDQQTYIYKKDAGDMKKLTLIAVNFKNAFRGADQNLATVNGVWQISDTFADVSNNKDFDQMTITSSNENGIKMENKDNDMTLSRNKDLVIMPGVNIKTADSADLRYYIYKPVTVDGAAVAAEAPVANMTAATKTEAAATEKVAAATTAAAAATEKVAAAKENLTAATEKVAAAKENVTAAAKAAPAAAKKQPGFEGIFAIAGLLAVAYLVLGKKE